MMKLYSIAPVLIFFFCLTSVGFSQEIKIIESTVNLSSLTNIDGDMPIKASAFKIYEIDIDNLATELEGVARTSDPNSGFIAQIQLPHPDGNTYPYTVIQNTTMSKGLQEKFPQIRSYDAYGVGFLAKAKIDITPEGLHAMIMLPGQSTLFIDPAVKGIRTHYMVYKRTDFITSQEKECLFAGESIDHGASFQNDFFDKVYLSCEMRVYRLALAATVEYTNFHGGTVANAIAAQVTTMNRVNGIYERDLGVSMTIIPNNDLLIYTGDPNADPYTNGDAFSMLSENQSNVNTVIGAANYDIGHVFGTNSGGVAGLGVICINNSKARGVTGSSAPINDPFDVDYVAHEIGHQFGANHTQNNNCNRNASTAMETGSGSTIMGYAGICPPNVQGNSDDHFHGISLQEMGNRISQTSCEARTPIQNSPPIITGTNANIFIPAGTPFALTAFAEDPDGDELSFCWEQMDNQISQQPPLSTATQGPNFRSYSPTTNSTRYFPRFQNLISSNQFALNWERVPTVDRMMKFRVTVRDQPLGVAGCPDYMDVTVTTYVDAGPFEIIYPSAQGIVWTGFDLETVTWDVANTDLPPINCDSVDLFLSIDGGLTYPITLVTKVPNTGEAEVLVPNTPTNLARVMIMSSDGTFFTISGNNFRINELMDDFVLSISPNISEICTPAPAQFNIIIDSLNGFDDPVNLAVNGLPSSVEASFSNSTLIPADTSVLTISNTAAIFPGSYPFTVEATSSSGTKVRSAELIVRSGTPATVIQLSPGEGEGNDSLRWEASPEVGATYAIQIANDAQFTDIIDEAYGITGTSFGSNVLAPTSKYFWRIRVVTDCGVSAWTAPFFDPDQVVLFPNPTISDLTINWVGNIKRIEISDATGKIVERRQILQGTTTTFDMRQHRAGVYHISMFSDKGKHVYDVIRL
jgi:hypothetical protein